MRLRLQIGKKSFQHPNSIHRRGNDDILRPADLLPDKNPRRKLGNILDGGNTAAVFEKYREKKSLLLLSARFVLCPDHHHKTDISAVYCTRTDLSSHIPVRQRLKFDIDYRFANDYSGRYCNHHNYSKETFHLKQSIYQSL